MISPNSLRVLAHAVIETLRISAPTVIEAVRGQSLHPEWNARLDSWSKKLLNEAGIVLDVTGREHLRDGEVYVIMSNHQSMYDIPVVFQALARPLRMVAKKELFRVPIWGKAMKTSGFVEIDRKNRESAIKSLKEAKRLMERDGISLWIAPEGTRSRSGIVAPFKKGGFHMALDAGLRILPITIDGTRDVLQKGGRRVEKGSRVRVTLPPPVDAADYGYKKLRELMADVRATIVTPLPAEFRGHA